MKKTLTAVAALINYAVVTAYDNGPSWKKDADGKIETDADGNPILIVADGKEQSVKTDTIPNLQNEAKTHRQAKETLEGKLAKFGDFKPEEIDDARKAMQTVQDIDDKKLIDAGEVETLRQQVKDSFQAQLDTLKQENTTLKSGMDDMRISEVFGASKYIQDNVAVPLEMFRATFGKHFKVEDGKVVPFNHAGNRMLSQKNAGENADCEEAFEILVEAYSQKDAILKAPDQRGSGSDGKGGNTPPGSKTMKRTDFNKLTPSEQSELSIKGEVSIVD